MPIDVADFHFFTTAEYFEHLLELIAKAKAGERVTVATMTLVPGERIIGRVLSELRAAAERGAIVLLLVDARTFLSGRTIWNGEMYPGPLFFNGELPLKLHGQFRAIYHALEALQDAGGTFCITNDPGRRFTNPVAGRAHWKFAVIGDQVFAGGCNLEGYHYLDIMVAWHDAGSAQKLEDWAQAVVKEGSVAKALGGDDVRYRLSDTEELFLDVGVRGQSQILVNALKLIDEAQDFIVISSQFFPNDVTGRHLLAAHQRGVKVQILYNHLSNYSWPTNFGMLGVLVKARRVMPRSFFADSQRKGYLHAKALVTENGAIVGSHNLVNIGVKVGTAELVIESTSNAFGRGLLECLHRQVGRSLVGLD